MAKISLPCYAYYIPGEFLAPEVPGIYAFVPGGVFRDAQYAPLGPVTVYQIYMINDNDEDYDLPKTVIRDGPGGEIKFTTPFTWGGQAVEGYDSCKSIVINIPGEGIRFEVGPYMDPVYDIAAGMKHNWIQIVYE